MPLDRRTPAVTELADVLETLRTWQHDGGSVPLHPGDVGWNLRFGAAPTAAALRVWHSAERPEAVGFLDSPTLLRLAVAPDTASDASLAHALVADLDSPGGPLGAGDAAVEVRVDGAVRDLLCEAGWQDDESWSPLRRDLTDPVEPSGLRIEVVDGHGLTDRVAVQRAAFPTSTFTAERWRAMAADPAYADARCLVAYDGDAAVATTTVWSAGPGRPGLIEPLEVLPAHRGRGHGRAITLAAAAALRELGSSSATVCMPSANVAAVAAYASAGFTQLPAVTDLRRPERDLPGG